MVRIAALSAGMMLAGGALAQQPLMFQSNIYLKVGQSAILHGARATACAAPPPDWATVQTWLPPTELGSYADGGIRTRHSDSCKAEVKVRAVRFTARKPGTQRLRLFGDQVEVNVQ